MLQPGLYPKLLTENPGLGLEAKQEPCLGGTPTLEDARLSLACTGSHQETMRSCEEKRREENKDGQTDSKYGLRAYPGPGLVLCVKNTIMTETYSLP